MTLLPLTSICAHYMEYKVFFLYIYINTRGLKGREKIHVFHQNGVLFYTEEVPPSIIPKFKR